MAPKKGSRFIAMPAYCERPLDPFLAQESFEKLREAFVHRTTSLVQEFVEIQYRTIVPQVAVADD